MNFPLLFDFLGVESVVDFEFGAFWLHIALAPPLVAIKQSESTTGCGKTSWFCFFESWSSPPFSKSIMGALIPEHWIVGIWIHMGPIQSHS